MRRLSLRVGLSVFASATLLGGGAAASAIELAPEEQCQLSSVLSSQDDESSQDAVLSSQDTVANPVSYTHLTLPTTLHECRSRWSPYHKKKFF